uniref:Uncharacterized protein n=1 Tax=Phlebotomus papatasi TaxID=29031 RepID=A0A1B0D0Y1_PHLPP
MPTPVLNESNNSTSNEIIVKTAYNGQKMITYISESITFDELCQEIRGMCQFSPDQTHLTRVRWKEDLAKWDIYAKKVDEYVDTTKDLPVKESVEYLTNALVKAAEKAIPKYSGVIRDRYVPWWNSDISRKVFTMKWVDEENDPCTISSQLELNEAIRLYELNRDSELLIHGELMNFSNTCLISAHFHKLLW